MKKTAIAIGILFSYYLQAATETTGSWQNYRQISSYTLTEGSGTETDQFRIIVHFSEPHSSPPSCSSKHPATPAFIIGGNDQHSKNKLSSIIAAFTAGHLINVRYKGCHGEWPIIDEIWVKK